MYLGACSLQQNSDQQLPFLKCTYLLSTVISRVCPLIGPFCGTKSAIVHPVEYSFLTLSFMLDSAKFSPAKRQTQCDGGLSASRRLAVMLIELVGGAPKDR